MTSASPKIFGIGFHRTGTTSLGRAFELLGYTCCGPFGLRETTLESVWGEVEKRVPQFDAFQDNPWPIVFEQLDAHYPGNKFVLTIREPEEWLESVVRHFGTRSTPMRAWIYGEGRGSPLGNERAYLDRFVEHNRRVRAHFSGRQRDLLVMDVTAGDGWDALCPFLGREAPDVPFPRLNRREDSN